MKPTFKLFHEYMSLQTEEQIDEIFGKFFSKTPPAVATQQRAQIQPKLQNVKDKLQANKNKPPQKQLPKKPLNGQPQIDFDADTEEGRTLGSSLKL